MKKAFVPSDFDVPRIFDTPNFHFRVLEDAVAEADFEAVMSSQNRLRGIFGPDSNWPRADMTLEENRESLKVHKPEFELREAFAYSIFSESREKCLGSVYIDPSRSANFDCEVYLWIRDDSIAFDSVLYDTVVGWLQDAWPFSRVAFPGRLMSWGEWAIELSAR